MAYQYIIFLHRRMREVRAQTYPNIFPQIIVVEAETLHSQGLELNVKIKQYHTGWYVNVTLGGSVL